MAANYCCWRPSDSIGLDGLVLNWRGPFPEGCSSPKRPWKAGLPFDAARVNELSPAHLSWCVLGRPPWKCARASFSSSSAAHFRRAHAHHESSRGLSAIRQTTSSCLLIHQTTFHCRNKTKQLSRNRVRKTSALFCYSHLTILFRALPTFLPPFCLDWLESARDKYSTTETWMPSNSKSSKLSQQI